MDRPRRSTRAPQKELQTVTAAKAIPAKRKALANESTVDPAQQLKSYLESSKSPLTKCEITDIIHVGSWAMLSDEDREYLQRLLPPTAFEGYIETLDPGHPAQSTSNAMAVDNIPPAPSDVKPELNLGFFTDGHFLSAARTFQDHIFSNWFSEKHLDKVAKYEEGVRSGSLAAPWKDDEWEREHPAPPTLPIESQILEQSSSLSGPSESSARAGGAAQIKLFTLAKAGIVQVGDVLVYKRTFAMPLIIEKDCVVQSINHKTYALTVLTQTGTEKDLPQELLCEPETDPLDPPESTRSVTITSLSMLESGLLDLDGRLEKAKRPNGNAWKCFTIWRWRTGAEFTPYDSRGGRENHGTLFYLRSNYYHDL